MVTGGTSVMMITHQHRLNCILPTGGQRLKEILNERTTEYLHILDVQVFHSIDADVCVANLPDALISKSSICLVIIPTMELDWSALVTHLAPLLGLSIQR